MTWLLDHHAHSDSDDPAQVRAFVRVLQENGIRVCLSGGQWVGDHSYPGNAATLAIARQYPEWIFPLAWVDLDQRPDPAGIARLVEAGYRGFKFIAPWHAYDHDLYMPVYAEIERSGLPALFHTGAYRPCPAQADPGFRRPLLSNMHPLTLDRIARSFPRFNLIMAHLGTSFFRREAAMLLRLHENLYADLAGSGSWGAFPDPQELAALLTDHSVYGTRTWFHKLLFGSDAYITIPELVPEARKNHLRLIPAEHQAAVMGGTMARLLGLKPQPPPPTP